MTEVGVGGGGVIGGKLPRPHPETPAIATKRTKEKTAIRPVIICSALIRGYFRLSQRNDRAPSAVMRAYGQVEWLNECAIVEFFLTATKRHWRTRSFQCPEFALAKTSRLRASESGLDNS
jgi:hypothetical protein